MASWLLANVLHVALMEVAAARLESVHATRVTVTAVKWTQDRSLRIAVRRNQLRIQFRRTRAKGAPWDVAQSSLANGLPKFAHVQAKK